ncbi:MAG: hypothetical protein KTR33_12245 [Gammaproteobacteria bacterium]|nr:hypothetical protein [Gammaproteobacteria bacterium]
MGNTLTSHHPTVSNLPTGDSAAKHFQVDLAGRETAAGEPPVAKDGKTPANRIQFGAGSIKAGERGFFADPDSSTQHASLSRIAVELSAVTGVTELKLPGADSMASASLARLRIAEHASYSVSHHTNSYSVEAEAGAEAALFDSTVALGLHINPKAVADSAIRLYNRHLDPIVDRVAGTDIPEVPELPEAWNRTLSLSAELNAGWGLAINAYARGHLAKHSGGLELGGRISPIGLGMIVGAGIGIRIK